MSKYIIEIKPEYEDSFKGLMILGAKDSNLFVDTLAVENLEELNSDYINEHFGDLQDTAYKKGLHDGESKCGYCNEYQRGLDDAWDAARKIVEMTDPPYWGVFNEYKNDLFGKITASEAIEKLKVYEEKQKADDDIKAGDIVYLRGDKYIVSYINDDECADLIHIWSGSTCARVSPDCLTRTGKHYDIDKILEEMKS